MGERGTVTSHGTWRAAALWVALTTGQLYGQILHATGPLPSFEVATIKRSDGGSVPSIGTASESRTMDVTARNLIEQAYQIPWTPALNERVAGGPGWIDVDRFDVDGRIDASLMAAFQKMSKDAQKGQTSLMMQSLLAERFKLKVHFESRELPEYALTVAKGGVKLGASKSWQQQPRTMVLPGQPGFQRRLRLYAKEFWCCTGDKPPR